MSGIYASLQQAQILILEILNVFLWLKFSPSLFLNKIEHFETASNSIRRYGKRSQVQGSTFRVRDRDKIEDPKSS
jgi:hypothetical protein